MNKEHISHALDDLPILTEVVVPSPVGIKTPAPRTAAATAAATPQVPALPASPAPDVSTPRAEPTGSGNAPLHTLNPDLVANIRETLIKTARQQIFSEIPLLVEAALQSALPAITREIQEGLEESIKQSIKQTLDDLLLETREKSHPVRH